MSTEDRDDKDPLQSLIAEILDTENRGETVDRDSLLGNRLDELVSKLCDGAVAPLLLNLVSSRSFSRDDIARFRKMLEDAEDARKHEEDER